MNLPQKQTGQVFERVLRTKTGTLARVKFLVMEFEGKPWVKVLSIEAIEGGIRNNELGIRRGKILCLPCLKTKEILPEVEKAIDEEIESPFFELFFLTSQPTRAPSSRI
ncbi:MAG: hypothetical protein WC250_00295 [Candidatus Paceibacterota bacterium]